MLAHASHPVNIARTNVANRSDIFSPITALLKHSKSSILQLLNTTTPMLSLPISLSGPQKPSDVLGSCLRVSLHPMHSRSHMQVHPQMREAADKSPSGQELTATVTQ